MNLDEFKQLVSECHVGADALRDMNNELERFAILATEASPILQRLLSDAITLADALVALDQIKNRQSQPADPL